MNHSVAICTRDCLEINEKVDNFFLLRVKTPIHLFTYSLSGNKMEKWTTFSWSELKQLFTYSPIHLFLASSHVHPFVNLGGQNQNGTEVFTLTRIGRMRLKDGIVA